MGFTSNRMMKKLGLCFLGMLPLLLMAQQPFINGFNPSKAEVGSEVEISGFNLAGAPKVFFSGVEANVLSSSANLIRVEVPFGAQNGPIFVLNNQDIAQSNENFFISFGGTELNAFDAEFAVNTTEFAAADICMCDLNGDSKNDIVIVHNRATDPSAAEITIFLNNVGDNDTDAFVVGADFQISQSINIDQHNDGFIGVTCNDFDNDGIKDLAFTSNFGTDANDVFVLNNPGTGIFPTNGDGEVVPAVAEQLPRTPAGDQRQPSAIVSADFDKDGRIDLAVGNSSDQVFHIFRNIGTPGSIDFISTPVTIPTDETTGLLYAADLNNDGTQDVITLPFRESSSGISLYRNLSVPGSFNFVFDQRVSNGGETSDVEVGDLDNDGDLEIVVVSNLRGRVSYFENQSGNSLFFGGSNNLTTAAANPNGVSLADMNGDGSLDITVANAVAGGIYLFPNTTSGAISFGTEEIRDTENTGGLTGDPTPTRSTRNIVSGDLNGDGKPDLAYTRSTNLDEKGFLGILLNRNCIIPTISPGEFEYCLNSPFSVETFSAVNATYLWEIVSGTGTIAANGQPEAEITITAGATAEIRVTVTQDGCSESESLSLEVAGGSPVGTPTINVSSTGTICTGDVVVLSSSLTSDNYLWELPDGTETNQTIIQLDPVTVADAGTYTLRIQDTDGCISQEAIQTLEVSSAPSLSIAANGLLNFCDELTLRVPDFSTDGISYQWKESGANVDENSAELTVTQSGTYTVQTTNTDNCSIESEEVTVNRIDLPVSIIDGPRETCADVLTFFSAASSGETGFSLAYEWLLDGVMYSNARDTAFQLDAGTYQITLNTNYLASEVFPGPSQDVCQGSTTISLTVSNPPNIAFNISDLAPKCQGDALPVSITSPANNTITAYTWTVNAGNEVVSSSSEASIDVTTPAGVDTVMVILSATTDIGCQVTDTVRVRNFQSDIDITSPDFNSIVESDSATLEEAIFINLASVGNLSNINWEPGDLIDDPTSNEIQYFPRAPRSIVRLAGIDADGCNVFTEVVINLDNLRPKRTFSPNDDGTNDCWEILNISELGQGCEVYIFDSRGRNETPVIKDFPNSNCVWDGTSSGKPVPEGIYYYVLKCEQEEFSKSGSILLAR
ncbi:MAG: FG-GAP-like repeat-containing protein [Bacteroidota bacterium]